MEKELSEIYYSTKEYSKGSASIPKLAEIAGVSDTEFKEWLEKQHCSKFIYHLQSIAKYLRYNV